MPIKLLPRWGFENEHGQHLHADILPLLENIDHCGRLTIAAKKCGISYRHAWNLLNQSTGFFGLPMVVLEKGRGAKLTELGLKLLRSSQRIEARLAPDMDSFATELNAELQSVISNEAPLIKIFASHGYAVALMTQFARTYQVEIHYHAPEHALMALNEGRCRIAGFHQPIGMDIPSQKKRYRELLDPKRFGVIRFIRRQQGLIFKQDNPYQINSIKDLGKGSFRFINRQNSSGTRVLLEQLLRDNGVNSSNISGYENMEFTHSAVAAHIASDIADVGFGVEAAARRFGLGFAPVIEEYYLWAYPLGAENDDDIQAFIASLCDAEFQSRVNQLPGYRCDHCGSATSANWLFT